jgi:hypothetical protein
MHQITPVGDANGRPDNTGAIRSAGQPIRAGAGAPLSGIDPAAVSGISNAIPITRIHAAVAQMLQSIGGGAENDKVLQMLIALMILLTLLKEQTDQASSLSQALSPLGRGNGQGSVLAAYYSSTTITIEQTTTTVWFQGGDSYANASQLQQSQQGAQIDVAA